MMDATFYAANSIATVLVLAEGLLVLSWILWRTVMIEREHRIVSYLRSVGAILAVVAGVIVAFGLFKLSVSIAKETQSAIILFLVPLWVIGLAVRGFLRPGGQRMIPWI